MSYRCQNCGKQVPPSTQAIRVVTEVRRKEYSKGRLGTEIVTEKAVCVSCSVNMREAGELATLDGYDDGAGD